ncbi:MAG: transglutaminase family protein, partial [Planctomycetes bacterium]|nr:transglutaminase family protein [Planctomycetota bacterium]
MGYRLPLDSLPWAALGDLAPAHQADPTWPRRPLPPAPAPVRAQAAGGAAPAQGVSAAGTVRTALCVEPRGGVLHVFLPPVPDAEGWLALVAAVEGAAADTGLAVQLEGYGAPSDARLRLLQVTPDPGVIEVNIHHSTSWDELAATTRRLYQEARACRLGAEKFMLDGRHIGTGGGNHITVGGPTPLESPFLRRPDLLGSLVAYWHNHPSLSYLFSGLFTGPTSQAPRADEARSDTAYELQTALRQLPVDGSSPPWLVDRVMRHLLIDLTGNTHRAEFCIDKLYSPDSAGGRRGLLELRAFEMPPHPEMSLAQQLLVRALVARFWREPYRAPLAQWGTQLGDRWALPWAVEKDFAEVLAETRAAGIPLDDGWFAPHREFRFPRQGAVVVDGVELELRQAIEHWHVLGEEGSANGTARYVDSSVERLQVRLSGATPGRHVVTVNGVPCPLHATGTGGEYVCGVRYRAWCPPSCLHPTVGVHAPLVFDVVDRWNARALFGCTYHVSHPGGLAYEVRPVNANAAETRRQSRFVPFGLTPGERPIGDVPIDADFPFTLDLRRGS